MPEVWAAVQQHDLRRLRMAREMKRLADSAASTERQRLWREHELLVRLSRDHAGDTLAALVVLGLFGYWAIAVFAIGVWFLLWVVRICVIVWLGLAYLLRRACTGQ